MFKGPNGVGKGDKPRSMKIPRKEFSLKNAIALAG